MFAHDALNCNHPQLIQPDNYWEGEQHINNNDEEKQKKKQNLKAIGRIF